MRFAAPILRARCAALAIALSAVAQFASASVAVSDAYYSPRNKERPIRKSTRFIILHTTEGSWRGAAEKLKQRGEANYLVAENGKIYRIIDDRRVAYHCGRSMWNNQRGLDDVSVGVEIAGYHNKDITAAQYASVRALLATLKAKYKVPDSRILPHSMVAYGAPNRWQRRSHRGRKRCGMRFAISSVRAKLGLGPAPASDPDVAAKRLVVGDPYLARVLYARSAKEQEQAAATYSQVAGQNVISATRSAWDIARERYNKPTTLYVYPDGTRHPGDTITNWKGLKAGTTVLLGASPADSGSGPETPQVIGEGGLAASDAAGEAALAETTIYLLPNGQYLRGSALDATRLAALPKGTRVFSGYVVGGPVTARCAAYDICGASWRAPDTYFLFPDKSLHAGDRINPTKIPVNTVIFYKN
jgi:N-acetylmuramoyl-L-alanine amidase